MGKALLIGALLAILAAALAWAIWIWASIPGTELSGHGVAALVLGIVGSLVVGCGLMALVFYSARHGYDDRIRYEDDADLG